LISTLTVLENLLLPMELNGRSAREEAYGLLERVGLRDRADSYPDRLSGGERQRVAIARALAHHPLLILADEPTGNLDFDTGAAVMSLLEALVREQGTTMIVATHDRDIIPRADRVVLLKSGRLEDVARGALEEHASGMPRPPAEGI
jgi:putative ABC transport system ATP-binding protein